MQKFVLSGSFVSTLKEIDNETALCGPDGNPDRTVIDEIMGVPFRTALIDYCFDAGITYNAASEGKDVVKLDDFILHFLSEQDPVIEVTGSTPTIIVPAMTAGGENLGMLALTKNENGRFYITGCFSGSNLSVDPDFQENGIGRALTLARLMSDEELPTWNHDKPGYTAAGVETVRSAVTDLQNICEYIRGNDAETPYALMKYKIDVEIEGLSPCP
jgi:hypothetical protein